MKARMNLLFVMGLFLMVFCCSALADVSSFSNISEEATYYIDSVNGNDLNDGLSIETAFATIQRGINAAEDGEKVLVYPGLYAGQVTFAGKAIMVQGIVDTTGIPILMNPYGFAVSFHSGEGYDSVLKNFVITNSFLAVIIAIRVLPNWY